MRGRAGGRLGGAGPGSCRGGGAPERQVGEGPPTETGCNLCVLGSVDLLRYIGYCCYFNYYGPSFCLTSDVNVFIKITGVLLLIIH